MELRIISKLWAAIYDLLMYVDGNSKKSLDDIHAELDAIEMMCRPYADADEITEDDTGMDRR